MAPVAYGLLVKEQTNGALIMESLILKNKERPPRNEAGSTVCGVELSTAI